MTKYNYMAEQKQVQPQQTSQLPVKDRILNSRLPDEIKKLMIEHPRGLSQAGLALRLGRLGPGGSPTSLAPYLGL